MAAVILTGWVSNETGCWRHSWARTHGVLIPSRKGCLKYPFLYICMNSKYVFGLWIDMYLWYRLVTMVYLDLCLWQRILVMVISPSRKTTASIRECVAANSEQQFSTHSRMTVINWPWRTEHLYACQAVTVMAARLSFYNSLTRQGTRWNSLKGNQLRTHIHFHAAVVRPF